jgi:DnaK suppressor protein
MEATMRKQQQPAGDRKRYDVLSRMLLDRQAEIKTRLRSLREAFPATGTLVKDEEEQSMQDFVVQMDLALVEMESETLRQINHALQRLDEGTYGVCEECDENIAEARLRALPFAELCRDCQERTEGEITVRPRNTFEQDLSINARNDRAPKGSEREVKALWNYASQALKRPPTSEEDEAPVSATVSPAARRSARPAPRVRSRARA